MRLVDMSFGASPRLGPVNGKCLVVGLGGALLWAGSAYSQDGVWTSRVVEEAQGRIVVAADGARTQRRFPGWPTDDYSEYPTHAYDDTKPNVAIRKVSLPEGVQGEQERGKRIWERAPCINCHAVPGDGRWAGNLGPSLEGYGNRGVDPNLTYQVIYDPRVVFPNTLMPPWGSAGLYTPQEIADLVAYVNGLKGSAEWPETERDPNERPPPSRYFGDNLDETRNPAVIYADAARDLWHGDGPKGQACSACHAGEPEEAMRGVAVTFPKFLPKYGRVVGLEEFLSAHAPETTGLGLPVEGDENLNMTTLIKMASNGLPIAVDLNRPEHKAAWERGKRTFYRRIGQRNHSCADCHSQERASQKWLGGRYIARAVVDNGLTASYPAWRTSFGGVWSLRRRIQWCMLPHGANNLSADSQEYADLELYMTSFDTGRLMNVPGLKD